MKKFEHTVLWTMLHNAEPQPETGDSAKMDEYAILDEFAAAVAEYCRHEPDLPERTRQLHLERGELAAMRKHLLIRGWLNGLHSLLERAIAIIDSELGIATKQWEHPGQCTPSFLAPDTPDLDLHFAGKSNDLGIVGLAEVVFTIFLSEEIIGANGKPVSLIRLANAFEYFLDMSFGDIYKQVEAIFRRKPFNRAKALDYLRSLLLREEQRRENGNTPRED
jgi:hypothetical protein